MRVLTSPRGRRRLAWVGGLLLVAGLAAAAVVLVPESHQPREHLRPGAVVLTTPRDVRMTPARRRAVDELLDTFVPSAVERRDPLRALPLVTPSYRAGVSDEEWRRGNLPVFPYHTSNKSFHEWTLNYAYSNEMSVELLLHPARTETLGAQAFTVDVKRANGRWRIDSFVPSAAFAPAGRTPRIKAQPDYSPLVVDRGQSRLSAKWLLVPAVLLASIVLVPVGFGLVKLRRSRRTWRDYRADQARLD